MHIKTSQNEAQSAVKSLKAALPKKALPLNQKPTYVASVWDWPLQHDDGVVEVINDKKKFHVALNMHIFTPKEVEVKVTGDEELVIHCRNNVAPNQKMMPREVLRSYKLPSDIDFRTLKSHLTPENALVVTADKKKRKSPH